MKIIYKYQCELERSFILTMPKGSRILDVQMQFGIPQMWVLVDTYAEGTEERMFGFVGTGAQFSDENMTYVKTIQDGPFMWHLFEAPE